MLNSAISTIDGHSSLWAFQFWNQSAFEIRCFRIVKVRQASVEFRLYFIVSLQLDCHRNYNMAAGIMIIALTWIRDFFFIHINISISTGRRCLPCCQIKCINSILRNCEERTIKMIAIIVFSRIPFNLK